MVGLYAFFYGALHLLCYIWFDKWFDLAAMAEDVARRRFILVGVLAFTSMVPLAVTSTDRMIKRLGGKRWQKLHRLVYLSAAAGVLHYYLLVKADVRKPLAFAAVFAVLLGYRAYASYTKRAAPLSLKAR
jgi:sulfoxide reductase heme-binding subunit YedZ